MNHPYLKNSDNDIKYTFSKFLHFVTQLNADQNLELTKAEIVQTALKLTEISVMEIGLVGAIYEESLKEISSSISEIADSIKQISI